MHLGDNMKKMYRDILAQLKDNKAVVLMSLYKTMGSTPRKKGAKMAMFEDNSTVGTVGGGAVEFDCTLCAKEVFKTKVNFKKTYTLNQSYAESIGMVCGGKCSIFFQYIESNSNTIALFEKVCTLLESNTLCWLQTKLDSQNAEMNIFTKDDRSLLMSQTPDSSTPLIATPSLSNDETYYTEPLVKSGTVYVFGGGHISQALCPLLCTTEFKVVVYEDNIAFADQKLFLSDVKIVNASFLEINDNIDITENDYAVVLTRGHKSDNEVLRQIMSKNPSYLGVIGSKKKVAAMHEYLSSCGFSDEQINAIHSPIGIDINAQTPQEIAVSITAQLIKHRNTKVMQEEQAVLKISK